MDADPVKATVSCSVSRSSRPRDPPATNCRLPSGSNPEAMISFTTASARYDAWEAGFTTVGTPARKAGASFSSIPQTGKLNALICRATPRRGV